MFKLVLLFNFLWMLLTYDIYAKRTSIVKLNKLSCENTDHNYVEKNGSCIVKTVNEHKNIGFFDMWLRKIVDNVQIAIRIFRDVKTHRVSLMDFRVGWCSRSIGGKGQKILLDLLLKSLENKTNVVHDCPFEGHIYVHDFWWDPSKTVVPLPEGNFVLEVKYFSDIKVTPWLIVKLYFKSYKINQ